MVSRSIASSLGAVKLITRQADGKDWTDADDKRLLNAVEGMSQLLGVGGIPFFINLHKLWSGESGGRTTRSSGFGEPL